MKGAHLCSREGSITAFDIIEVSPVPTLNLFLRGGRLIYDADVYSHTHASMMTPLPTEAAVQVAAKEHLVMEGRSKDSELLAAWVSPWWRLSLLAWDREPEDSTRLPCVAKSWEGEKGPGSRGRHTSALALLVPSSLSSKSACIDGRLHRHLSSVPCVLLQWQLLVLWHLQSADVRRLLQTRHHGIQLIGALQDVQSWISVASDE